MIIYQLSPLVCEILILWAGNGAAGLAFYTAGYWLSRYESKWWLLIPCGLVFLYCCFWGFPMVDMLWCKLLNGSFRLWVPVAIGGIIVFDGFCRAIMKLYAMIEEHFPVLTKRSILEAVGRNAMLIYVSHVLLLESYCFVANQYGDSSWPHFLCMSILMAVLFAIVLVRACRNKAVETLIFQKKNKKISMSRKNLLLYLLVCLSHERELYLRIHRHHKQ